MLPGPPAIYQTILNHPDLENFDMSTLRLAVTGAAVIPVEMIVQMREKLGFETVVTGYGLTEGSGLATMCRHDDDPETIAKPPAGQCQGWKSKSLMNRMRRFQEGTQEKLSSADTTS